MKKREYLSIVRDILNNEDFQKLKDYYHHNSSIYDHVVRVSYISYKVCKKLNLDYVSGARGALLHDFFLYDWRQYKKEKHDMSHGYNHPLEALENAQKHFVVNKIEEDIIIKHMWPKSFGTPKYKESLVVTLVDKYCACGEYLSVEKVKELPVLLKLVKN